jgi:LPS sulfotransferase NodH
MSVAHALAERPPAPVALARLAYVVCGGPHAGGAALCEVLADTGRAGRPAEYFDIREDARGAWAHRFGVEDPSQYLDKVVEAGTGANGVFGLELHWHEVTALMSAFGADPRGVDIDAQLARRFETRRYIWLRRRNKVAQAIASYRATVGSVWRIGPNLAELPSREAAAGFDAERIEHHLALVEHFDRQWQTWFRMSRQRALVVIHEDFREQHERTVTGVCDFIGVNGPGLRVAPPRLEGPVDAISLDWEAQFRRLKGLPAEPAAVAPRPPPQVAVLREPPVTTMARSAAQPAPAPRQRPAKIAAPPSARKAAAAAQPSRGRAPAEASQITAYDTGTGQGVRLAASPARRDWMDATPQRFANRCLPLVIANQHGWLMLGPHRIEAMWDGRDALDSVVIRQPDGVAPYARSHFGSGILTFLGDLLFRTPAGVNLHVRGPANLPKDGIAPLEAIVETDWSEATFTMNWKFTRPNCPVVFEANEPFAMISPVRRGDIETFRPQLLPIQTDPELAAGFKAWSVSREAFNRHLREPGSQAQAMGWQRHYMRGETLSRAKAESHQTKLFVSEFEDRRPATRNSSGEISKNKTNT